MRTDYPTTITFPEIENCKAIQKFQFVPDKILPKSKIILFGKKLIKNISNIN